MLRFGKPESEESTVLMLLSSTFLPLTQADVLSQLL